MDLNDLRQSDDEAMQPMNPPQTALGLRHLVAIAVVTPVLMAAGVFWLHQMPIGMAPRTSDAVIEVSLMLQDPPEQIRPAAPQPQSEPPTAQPDPIIEDTVHSIPQDKPIEKPSETKTVQPTEPTQKPQASKPEVPSQLQADQTALAFQRMLLSHIARFRRYPEDARRQGIKGLVAVLFAMRRDGSVADVWVRTTSGNSELDAAAIDTIRRAVPLPHIPSELPDSLNVLIPVSFNLP